MKQRPTLISKSDVADLVAIEQAEKTDKRLFWLEPTDTQIRKDSAREALVRSLRNHTCAASGIKLTPQKGEHNFSITLNDIIKRHSEHKLVQNTPCSPPETLLKHSDYLAGRCTLHEYWIQYATHEVFEMLHNHGITVFSILRNPEVWQNEYSDDWYDIPIGPELEQSLEARHMDWYAMSGPRVYQSAVKYIYDTLTAEDATTTTQGHT